MRKGWCAIISSGFVFFLLIGLVSASPPFSGVSLQLSDSNVSAGEEFMVSVVFENISRNESNVSVELDIYFDDVIVSSSNNSLDFIFNQNLNQSFNSSSFSSSWLRRLSSFRCGSHYFSASVLTANETVNSSKIDFTIQGDPLTVTVSPTDVFRGTSILVSSANSLNQSVGNASLGVNQLGGNGVWDLADPFFQNLMNETGHYSFRLNETTEFNLSSSGLFQLDAWKIGFCLDSTTFSFNASSTTTTSISTTTTVSSGGGGGRGNRPYQLNPAKPKKTTSTVSVTPSTAPPLTTTNPPTTSVPPTSTIEKITTTSSPPPTTSPVDTSTTSKPMTTQSSSVSSMITEQKTESTLLKKVLEDLTAKAVSPPKTQPKETKKITLPSISLRSLLPSWRTVTTLLALMGMIAGAVYYKNRPKPLYKKEQTRLGGV
ncbi:MAG: hypothetical protein ABH950_03275 [Candidatus Altiarchaeota archaeon]